MSLKQWSEIAGVEMPQCKMQGCCCRGASPSVPFHKLLEKAANGESFARDFFTIFIPHDSHQAARSIEAGLVDRTLKAAEKDAGFNGPEDVVFYQCRYIGEDNKCQVWEDRPDLCRAYPDTPFVVFAPGCAFEPWSKAVRAKYFELKDDLRNLNEKKQLLERLKTQQSSQLRALEGDTGAEGTEYTKIDDDISTVNNLEEGVNMVMPLMPMFLVSPMTSTYL